MSVLGLIRFNWRIFLAIIVMAVASVGAMLYYREEFHAWLLGVAFGAVLLRDLGQCIKWSRTWPLTSELLDWSKVERMASENGLAA